MSHTISSEPGTGATESAAIARAAARLLASGRAVDLASTLTTIAVLVLAIVLVVVHHSPARHTWLLGVIVALGLAQKYYAVRVIFDSGLFNDLADAFQRVGDQDNDKPLIELDRALVALGLRKMPEDPPRVLAERVTGAKRKLLLQALCLILQWLIFFAASAIHA
jgi:hypothetical protein